MFGESEMNRSTIRKTAVCRFDKKGKVYIVESPLLDICHGIAETETEAWEIFEDALDAMYIKYLEGKTVGRYHKRGRPPLHGADFHVTVKPETKKTVLTLANYLDTSQGEVVDYLAGFWKAKREDPADRSRSVERLAGKPVGLAQAKRVKN